MSHDPQGFQIPVIFDVTAWSREEAGQALVDILAGHRIPGNEHHTGVASSSAGISVARVESWWTVEHVDKVIDGNDNAHGVVVFESDLDYLYALLKRHPPGSRDEATRHMRLTRYFDHIDGRIGTPGHGEADCPACDGTGTQLVTDPATNERVRLDCSWCEGTGARSWDG